MIGGANVFGISLVFGNGKNLKRLSKSLSLFVLIVGFVLGGCGGARGFGCCCCPLIGGGGTGLCDCCCNCGGGLEGGGGGGGCTGGGITGRWFVFELEEYEGIWGVCDGGGGGGGGGLGL